MAKQPKITIENTKFIFKTNFAGDPDKDTYGSSERKANIIIPSREQAEELRDMGFNIKITKPSNEEDPMAFVPQYFVAVKANYDSEWPPMIYQVIDNEEPLLLDADTVGRIDKLYTNNVNVVLNPYYSEKNRRWGLYISTMYVEQEEKEDPFAARYRRVE